MKTMTQNKTLVAAAAVMMIMLGAQLAMAQGPGGGRSGGKCVGGGGAWCDGPGEGSGPMGARMAALLDLTEEQQAAVAKIREEGRQDNLELRKQMMRLRNELQGEMLKDEPSESKVLGLNAEMGKIRTELKGNRIKHRLAIRALLTPEQRDRMLLLGHDGRHGQGGRHGRGGKGHRCQGGFGGGPGGGCDQRGPGRGAGPRG